MSDDTTTLEHDDIDVLEAEEPKQARAREIQIRRREDAGYVPATIAQQAKKRLGSIMVGQAPLSGLSFEQSKKYLPIILGVDPSTPDFPKTAREFWADITLDVPFSGLNLEVGLDAEDEPLNIRDWIHYQWCLKHPLVAATQEEFDQDQTRRFYIYDPELAEKKQVGQANSRLDALTEFVEMRNDPTRVAQALRILGDMNPDRMSEAQQFLALEQIAQKTPQTFLKVVRDSDLEVRSLLIELVGANVVSKNGQIYTYTDQSLGDTETETVNYLKNQRNSKVVTELKAKLRAASQTLK